MTYSLPKKVQTTRLVLSPATCKHGQSIFDGYAQSPEVTKYLAWPTHQTINDTIGFLKTCENEWQSGKGFPYVIAKISEPTKVIGMFHAHRTHHGVNYGYVLRQNVWGLGYASELLSAFVDHAITHPEVFRAYAFCDAENDASARVMEKAGMKKEGLLNRYFVHPNISLKPRDCLMYAKTK